MTDPTSTAQGKGKPPETVDDGMKRLGHKYFLCAGNYFTITHMAGRPGIWYQVSRELSALKAIQEACRREKK